MRLIFSRKGFDAGSAGFPSPILPDGRLVSLPIPRTPEPVSYEDVRYDGGSLGPVVEELTGGRIQGSDDCHLDPDLRPGARPRSAGWRALFGQAGAAAGHLLNQKVEEGDLFLFFGWFRQSRRVDGRLWYAPDAPDLHLLFGWLQVGSVHPEPARRADELPAWARDHPHADPARPRPNNLLFAATDELRIGGRGVGVPGGGCFEELDEGLVLTADGHSRSVWRLPLALWRDDPENRLTYHRRRERWSLDGHEVLLRTVGQGQEFVLETDARGEKEWMLDLFESAP